MKKLFWVAAIPAVFLLTAQLVGNFRAVVAKLSGRASECSSLRILAMPVEFHLRRSSVFSVYEKLRPVEMDTSLNLQRFATEGRSYWIKRGGTEMNESQLLAFLISDHRFLAASRWHVRPGDIVLDCGAHIGVFTDQALRMGAGTVVAVEPDRIALECLRRNFADEIKAGKVIVYPKGVWSQESELPLFEAESNSGHNSVIRDHQHRPSSATIPLTTIDKLVQELHLERVDFIKLDIEGAERHALRGALLTLTRWKPRLMIDSHQADDEVAAFRSVLQPLSYRMDSGPCEFSNTGRTVVPHTTFWSGE